MKTVRIRYDDGTVEYAHVEGNLLEVLFAYADANTYEITVVA